MTGSRLQTGVIVASLIAVVGALTGITYAAIPDGETINGCYGKQDGHLRVIASGAGEACRHRRRPSPGTRLG